MSVCVCVCASEGKLLSVVLIVHAVALASWPNVSRRNVPTSAVQALLLGGKRSPS